CTYTGDHTGKCFCGKGSQSLRKRGNEFGGLTNCPANSTKELVGLARLIFAQASCAEDLADLIFELGIAVWVAVVTQLVLELELGMAIVTRLILRITVWVAIMAQFVFELELRVAVVTALRIAVVTQFVFELELSVAVVAA